MCYDLYVYKPCLYADSTSKQSANDQRMYNLLFGVHYNVIYCLMFLLLLCRVSGVYSVCCRRANNGQAADHLFTNCSTFLRRDREWKSGRGIESQGESLGVRGVRESQEESVSQGGRVVRGPEEKKGESLGSMGVKRSQWDSGI
jgi:hypothetical protein